MRHTPARRAGRVFLRKQTSWAIPMAICLGAAVEAADWPMWGGRPDRNMVSDAKGLPTEWDVTTKKNIRWVAELGERTYGTPVVSGGKVFIGTNNGRPRDANIKGDRGVLMCFDAGDGRFLWQAVHEKLANPEAYDWPEIGVCSVPCVVGDRLYYVSNRGELICLDTEGFYDGENDGPLRTERRAGKTDADVVWSLDMLKELGVVPHQASASPPMVMGDLVYVITGNGIDEDKEKVKAPGAPSFIAVDRHSGKVVWKDASPGDRILEGQWSAAAGGVVGDRKQVVFPGGDGWLYAFDPTAGRPLWKFDGNAHKPQAEKDQRNHFIATPVIFENKVFVCIGQNPENGKGPGALWAIDATKTGDVTASAVIWKLTDKEFTRSISTVAIGDGLLYAAELNGYLNCLEVSTGKRIWRQDLEGSVWASPLIADGKVYIANEDGDVMVLQHGRQVKVLAKNSMNETVHATVSPADGVLYIATMSKLYAIGQPKSPTSAPHSQTGIGVPKSERTEATCSDAIRTLDGQRTGGSETAAWGAAMALGAEGPTTTRGASPASAPTAAWPMHRGSPQLTGRAFGTLPDKPRVLWKRELPEGTESSPAIVGDSAFLGCDDGFLYALALADGAVRWKYKAGSSIRSSPCVVHGLVCFGDGKGVFHAVDAAQGTPRWSLRTRGEINSSPVLAGDRLLFGSYDNHLYCLSADDGRVIWKHPAEDKIHGTPGVSDDRVLFAGCDGQMHVIRLSDGAAVAEVKLDGICGAAAAIQGPMVFVGTFGNQVLGINWQTGKAVWTYEPADEKQPFYGSAAVDESWVVIGGRDKRVHALDVLTGKPRWTFLTGERIDSSPLIIGNRVWIGSNDGKLYVLDLFSGREVWRFDAGSGIIGSPAFARGRMLFASEDGVVYCLGA